MSTLIYAFLFLVIPLGFFAFFSWALLYHILKFGFRKSTNTKLAFLYSFVMIALALFVIENYFAVDWNDATMRDFLKKCNLNNFI